MIIVSHQPDFIRAHCQHAAVLVDGKLTTSEQVDDAFTFYQEHST